MPDPPVPTTPSPVAFSALTASADGRASSPATPVALSLSDLTAFADAIVSKAIAKLEAAKPSIVEEIIQSGPLMIDGRAFQATLSGRPVSLKPLDFRVLRTLAENAGHVLSREHLLELVWPDPIRIASVRVVDVAIRRIRVALGSASRLVETVRGAGYRLRRSPRE